MEKFEFIDEGGAVVTATAAEIREFAKNGRIKQNTPIRRAGSEAYTEARNTKGLQFKSDEIFDDIFGDLPESPTNETRDASQFDVESRDARSDLVAAMNAPLLTESRKSINDMKTGTPSKNRDEWRDVASSAKWLGGLHTFAGWVCVAGALVMLVASLAGSGTVGESNQLALAAVFVGMSSIPLWCLGLILRAISVYSKDRAAS